MIKLRMGAGVGLQLEFLLCFRRANRISHASFRPALVLTTFCRSGLQTTLYRPLVAFEARSMSNAGMESIIDAQAAAITPEKALLNGIPTAAEWSQGSINESLVDTARGLDRQQLPSPARL